MTITEFAGAARTERAPSLRSYAMTPPVHFAVTYRINPWMDPAVAVDTARAHRQWNMLRETYIQLGHSVSDIPPVPGLPDMVYAANGGLVVGGVAIAAQFRHPQRKPEGAAYAAWMNESGLGPVQTVSGINEGEGDFLVVGDRILAGTGFRTDRTTHQQVQHLTGLPVISLELVDPRYYHLDTALGVLDAETITYYPAAFSKSAQRILTDLYPTAIAADDADAAVLGLNLVSDGLNVVMTDAAPHLAAQLTAAGFHPIGVDLSELLKGGGGVKCCTLELRSAQVRP